MISYPTLVRQLESMVATRLPTTLNKDGTPRKGGRIAWSLRAASETERLTGERQYSDAEGGPFWRELKDIFSEIQGEGKCAYCETKLDFHRVKQGAQRARPTGDIEHYRPKNGVVEWPSPDGFLTGGEDPDCYYLLAYHLRNYLLACEVCNQDFKLNYFPISGPRAPAHRCNADDLNAEKPYLLHPLDPAEPDAEDLIEFIGVSPVPKQPVGTPDYWRMRVTIQLLGLGQGRRWSLDLARAVVIATIYLALVADPEDPVAAITVARLDDNAFPHRNCARSFRRLFETDRKFAEQIAIEAQKYVDRERARRQVHFM